jgi:hypothetical protein
MFRLFGTSVFLGVVLAALALGASAAVVPPDAPDYNWAQRDPSATPYEPTEPTASVAVLKVTLPADAPDYNWAQRDPSTAPYELTQPAGRVVVKVTLPADAPNYNWAQRDPSTAPYEPTEPATHH